MANELKPCPFCGGEAELVNYVKIEAQMRLDRPACYAICKNCGVKTKDVVSEDTTFAYKDCATELWNRRADDGTD